MAFYPSEPDQIQDASGNLINPAKEDGNLASVKTDLDTIAGAVTASVVQENIKQIAGTAISVNNGATDVGTQRVTLSSDSTGQVKLATGSNVIGSLSANQSINNVLIAGTAVSVNTGNADAGTQRVVLASNQPAVAVTATPSFATRSDTFTATGNGTTVNQTTAPLSIFSVEVKGTGAAATTWDVRLEGSLDGTNFTQILQHTNVTGDGTQMMSGSLRSPSLYFRSRVAALALGSATNIVVTILGMD